uniref:Transmembrane protein n=1 Tax=Parastrongyloides trichosuri TaxID=131310 RepID=A0A0N4Z203_PARTI
MKITLLIPHFIFAIIAISILATTTKADSSVVDEVKQLDPFQLRDSSLGCPIPVVGASCPESNALYYFKCCGKLLDSCCFRLQDWVTVLLLVMAALTVLAIIINIVRCIFCMG